MNTRGWNISSLRLIIVSVFVSLHSWVLAYDNRCPANLLQGAGSNTHVRTYNGKCYQFVGFEKYWWGARDYCWQKGGKLVTISDWYTNRFIVNTLNNLPWGNNGVWIGLNDLRNELTWEWVTERSDTHTKASWTNWGHGHPKGFWHSNRDCVRMNRKDSWRWHETTCQLFAWHYRFICEYQMRTTTTSTTTTTTTRTTPTTTKRTTTTPRPTTTTPRPTTTTASTPTTTTASTTADIFLGFQTKDIHKLPPGRLNRKRATTTKATSTAAPSTTSQHPNAIPAGWQKIQQQKEEEKQGTGMMVGAVMALLLSLIVLIIIIVVFYRRRRKKAQNEEDTEEVIFQNKSLKEECEKECAALLNSSAPDRRPRLLPDVPNGHKQNEYVVNVYQCTNETSGVKQHQMTLKHSSNDLDENETVTEGTDDEVNAETEVKTNAINEAKVAPVNVYVNPTAGARPTATVPPAQASTGQDGYEEPRSSGYLPMNGSPSDDRQLLITPEAEYTPPKPSFQYDSPKPMNIYSEIPDDEAENVYESLENIRRALGEKDA